MSDKISRYEAKIDEAVRRVLEGEQPGTLFEPARYILELGGKRLRPLLVLLSVDLFEGDTTMALYPAVAIEVFHNFSLVHDDLMDRAAIRRGHPTVHEKWNANVAVLSGDAMVFEAYKQLARVPSKLLPAVLELFSTTAMEVCKGQQYDMDFEGRDQVTEGEYLDMIRLKTGVLIGCSLKMGAILAETSPGNANALYDFGMNMGLAFQLKDDLLDVYGDPLTFGKRIGGDILCNKKTYLLIKALENANPAQRAELNNWLNAVDCQPEEKIAAVTKVYNELNLKAIVEKLIQDYYHASLECLALVQVTDDRKQLLVDLAEGLMYREK
ncbi:MAG TPA: polyprenyl synthetase family protein [Bacteroidales bacterium]|jgi:geranylgeranyl diphosphate synthase type II|nr:polyprenyl synthetase family protein [Bacteroidales bacterium]